MPNLGRESSLCDSSPEVARRRKNVAERFSELFTMADRTMFMVGQADHMTILPTARSREPKRRPIMTSAWMKPIEGNGVESGLKYKLTRVYRLFGWHRHFDLLQTRQASEESAISREVLRIYGRDEVVSPELAGDPGMSTNLIACNFFPAANADQIELAEKLLSDFERQLSAHVDNLVDASPTESPESELQ